jgi:glycosyltransferase involved in cell wall biosynthesis
MTNKPSLAIISHTPHYKDGSIIKGLGSTVREIDNLKGVFGKIYHVAPLHNGVIPSDMIEYSNTLITFVSLLPSGGKLFAKFNIIFNAPYNIYKILVILRKADVVQFRAPTSIGIYVLPILSLLKRPQRWVKYAGNWVQENPPLASAFQRWWLKKNFQKSFVTINGKWTDQPNYILTFENPCLDDEELPNSKSIGLKKNFNDLITICFVGALTEAKGIDIIIESLKIMKSKGRIKEVIFVGDGPKRNFYKEEIKDIGIPFDFKGYLNKNDIRTIYTNSQLILLPTASEGFPKVVAEAAAYGCIPIVSDVSCISQYVIHGINGFLIYNINSYFLASLLDEVLSAPSKLKKISDASIEIANSFTYQAYVQKLKSEVIGKMTF